VTVVATGFGLAAPSFRVVERTRTAKAVGDDDMGSYNTPAWKRREGRTQWGRGESRGESLEVPAFLRRQMD
jgi:CO dehydrogenase/acetyl-CoA synthase delta subunit